GLRGVAFSVPPLLKSVRPDAPDWNKDYTLWYAVGLSVRGGEPLYRFVDAFEIQYMYPPTLAVLVLAPLSALGFPGFVAVLSLANAAAWAACVRLFRRPAAAPGE